MTHQNRSFDVAALARVEGEGALSIDVVDGTVTRAELRIYEPPRFFEAFLRGRHHTEPPDLTARICGICPVAYQTSACHAIEAVCGVEVPEEIERLRRLLYYGEWIESHTLHIYLLHAPDFLGIDGATALADQHRPAFERGLELKKIGNQLVELIGGRAIHPVNVRVGGFHRAPTVRELRAFRSRLERAQELAAWTVEWVSSFEFPSLEVDHELLALHHDDRYAIDDGRLRSTGGLDIGPDEFDQHVGEVQVPHSTALHGRLHDGPPYLTGALARFAINFDQLVVPVRDAARAAGLDAGVRNPFRTIVVRALEVLHACTMAIDEIDRYTAPSPPAIPVAPRAGVGTGWSEAPRGVLWHRYELDAEGHILDARIVPPTSQNQAAIELDLRRFVQQNLALPDDALRHGSEQVIRNHDPCISCATHFLDLDITRR